jgi:hypothetical protein
MSEPVKRRSSAPDRRASRRRPPRDWVRIECRKGAHGLGRNIGKQFLDLSETGVRLLVSAELQVGDEAEIILTGVGSLNKPLKRVGKVIWAFKTDEDLYCVGLRFAKPLAYMYVQQMSSMPTLKR